MSRIRLSHLRCHSLPILATFCLAAFAMAPPAQADPSFDDHYLLVTSADLAPAFDPLVAHRTAQGYQVEVVTLEHILAVTTPLEDDAATLRAYLAQHHAQHGTSFVLLGGDASVIPARICHWDTASLTADYPSDLYFACFEGTWDADGDGIYAEPDDEPQQTPVLAVGRAPIATVGQAQTFVAKVLAYEDDAEAVRSRALMAAQVLTPRPWMPGTPVIQDGADLCEDLIPMLAALPPSIESTRMYQNQDAHPDALLLTPDALMTTLEAGNHGLLDLAVIVADSFMVIGYDPLLNSRFGALQNGPVCPVLLTTLGNGAAFQKEDCLATVGIRNADGGFVAAFGTTSYGYIAPLEVAREQWLAGLADSDPRLGTAWRASVTMAEPWGYQAYVMRTLVMLGDPALMLWGDVAVGLEDEDDDEVPAPLAERLDLEPNYPNPFNPRTTLAYSLAQTAHVHLAVYDLRGRRVTTLVDDRRTAGRHEVAWNGTDAQGTVMPAGLYLYRVSAAGQTRARRMVLAK